MTIQQAMRNRILQLCGQRGVTINKLATLAALPPSSVKNILYGKSQDPKLSTIHALCDGLGMTMSEFFAADDFRDLDPEP